MATPGDPSGFGNQSNPVSSTGAFLINHGAGHIAMGPDHTPGTSDQPVLMYGGETVKQFLTNTTGDLKSLKDFMNNKPYPHTNTPRNESYIQEMRNRFGKKKASANYK